MQIPEPVTISAVTGAGISIEAGLMPGQWTLRRFGAQNWCRPSWGRSLNVTESYGKTRYVRAGLCDLADAAAGSGTLTDVLDARTFLSQTDTNYYQALYGYLTALAALDRATGKPGNHNSGRRKYKQ